MPEESAAVSAFLAALEHPMADTVRRLRAGILRLDPAVSEVIKWNAPSFQYRGEDRVTFQLRRPDRVQLILHRGVKARPATGFRFPDPDGLIDWAAPDRGVISITMEQAGAARETAMLMTIHRWFVATRS